MGLILEKAPARLEGKLRLPGSKSSSNRWLIVEALSGQPWEISGLSSADDTRLLQEALKGNPSVINVGAAGTAMRFMTAYLAQKPGRYQLYGQDRAHDRPIAILVEALRFLGAEIDYLEKFGYPPLQITGKKLEGGVLKIDASVSSQYLTALLLIGCTMHKGLSLQWEGELSSAPYVAQTLMVLQQSDIQFTRHTHQVRVLPGNFQINQVQIEPDWSAAGYWLAFVCLLPANVFLEGLEQDSPQADKMALILLAELGLRHEFIDNGLRVWREVATVPSKILHWDFEDCPDLAPTLIVLCAALGHQATFTGLRSLRIKESDRLLALQTELLKFGAVLEISSDRATLLAACTAPKMELIEVDSWQDHRLVMSLSLLSALGHRLYFTQAEVVSKSYPAFWEDLAKFGFQLHWQHGR